MTIRTWLLIFTLAAGVGGGMSTETTSSSCPEGRICRIGSNCWINGVWYTPCPSEYGDPMPDPSPEIQPPM